MKKFIFSILILSFFLAGCSNQFFSNTGTISFTVPYGPSSSSRDAEEESEPVSFHCTFNFTFADLSTLSVEAESGESITLEDVPAGKCVVEAGAYIINNETADWAGTSEFIVEAGNVTQASITLKKTDKTISEIEISIPEDKQLISNTEEIDWSIVSVKTHYSDNSSQSDFVTLTDLYTAKLDSEIVTDKSFAGYLPVILTDKYANREFKTSIPMCLSLEGDISDLGIEAKVKIMLINEGKVLKASCSEATVNYIDKEGEISVIKIPMKISDYQVFVDDKKVEVKSGYIVQEEFRMVGLYNVSCNLKVKADSSKYPEYILFTEAEQIINSKKQSIYLNVGDYLPLEVEYPQTDITQDITCETSYSADDKKLNVKILPSDYEISTENIMVLIDGKYIGTNNYNIIRDDFGNITITISCMPLGLTSGYHSLVIYLETDDGMAYSNEEYFFYE